MGVREDRKEATRREIQKAALDLIESEGLDAVTVARIAERAGISDRTFFRYFESKEAAAVPGQPELITALVSHQLDASLSPAEIMGRLIEVCRGHLDREVTQHEFIRISRLLERDPKLLDIVRRQELRLVKELSRSLTERSVLEPMHGLLVAELIACTWRVAWERFAREGSTGSRPDPGSMFEEAVSALKEVTAPAAFGAVPGTKTAHG
ncbi:TetR/AcrR family transcriptional regulator [Arthrobacter sp. 7Tela_A1]|uniref:TetR/AcrR family transcriptional regulator n=1 Tax=Arthrobacter sp. 7Tela_A1 TaxID=3093745 RepID=UPI003BB7D4EC